MSWTYACPKCKALLNPNEAVVLVAQRGDDRMLIGFHPDPGNYEIFVPPGVTIEEGSRWEFSCPVCKADLSMEDSPNLCALEMLTGSETALIMFSRIAGEKATFVLAQRSVQAQFGNAAEIYLNSLINKKYIM